MWRKTGNMPIYGRKKKKSCQWIDLKHFAYRSHRYNTWKCFKIGTSCIDTLLTARFPGIERVTGRMSFTASMQTSLTSLTDPKWCPFMRITKDEKKGNTRKAMCGVGWRVVTVKFLNVRDVGRGGHDKPFVSGSQALPSRIYHWQSYHVVQTRGGPLMSKNITNMILTFDLLVLASLKWENI